VGKPLSQTSDEKEVSHGHEEAEEKEDVEVTLPARAPHWGYASALFREAQRSDLKPAAVVFPIAAAGGSSCVTRVQDSFSESRSQNSSAAKPRALWVGSAKRLTSEGAGGSPRYRELR
jgi:hypothetical protein